MKILSRWLARRYIVLEIVTFVRCDSRVNGLGGSSISVCLLLDCEFLCSCEKFKNAKVCKSYRILMAYCTDIVRPPFVKRNSLFYVPGIVLDCFFMLYKNNIYICSIILRKMIFFAIVYSLCRNIFKIYDPPL